MNIKISLKLSTEKKEEILKYEEEIQDKNIKIINNNKNKILEIEGSKVNLIKFLKSEYIQMESDDIMREYPELLKTSLKLSIHEEDLMDMENLFYEFSTNENRNIPLNYEHFIEGVVGDYKNTFVFQDKEDFERAIYIIKKYYPEINLEIFDRKKEILDYAPKLGFENESDFMTIKEEDFKDYVIYYTVVCTPEIGDISHYSCELNPKGSNIHLERNVYVKAGQEFLQEGIVLYCEDISSLGEIKDFFKKVGEFINKDKKAGKLITDNTKLTNELEEQLSMSEEDRKEQRKKEAEALKIL